MTGKLLGINRRGRNAEHRLSHGDVPTVVGDAS